MTGKIFWLRSLFQTLTDKSRKLGTLMFPINNDTSSTLINWCFIQSHILVSAFLTVDPVWSQRSLIISSPSTGIHPRWIDPRDWWCWNPTGHPVEVVFYDMGDLGAPTNRVLVRWSIRVIESYSLTFLAFECVTGLPPKWEVKPYESPPWSQ